jgi:predicted nucleic acid-binding protein
MTLLTGLLAAGRPILSTQVLSEFYWAVTRKLVLPLTHDEATAETTRLNLVARVVPLTWDVLEKALQAIATHQLPLWDAQILAAAVLNGATRVLSEDFQDGRVVEGVTFLNPFAPGFDTSRLMGS